MLFGPTATSTSARATAAPPATRDNVAQNKRSLLGKILRIDPRAVRRHPYTVPRDNPLVGRPGRGEIFAYGFRNPWRFSFDRATGAMAIGDVGDDRFEEIDYLPARKARGANFGWSAYEGFAPLTKSVPKSRTVLPVLAYPHGPGCAVTGGYVVRDPALSRIAGREIVGRYLFGDYCTGRLFALPPPSQPPRRQGAQLPLPGPLPDLVRRGPRRAGSTSSPSSGSAPASGSPAARSTAWSRAGKQSAARPRRSPAGSSRRRSGREPGRSSRSRWPTRCRRS